MILIFFKRNFNHFQSKNLHLCELFHVRRSPTWLEFTYHWICQLYEAKTSDVWCERGKSDKGKMKETHFHPWTVREKMHKWSSSSSVAARNGWNHSNQVSDCDNITLHYQIQIFSRPKLNRKNFARGALAWRESLQNFLFSIAIISHWWHFGAQFHLNYPQNALLLRNNHWLEAQHIWFDGISRFLLFLTIIFPSFAVY